MDASMRAELRRLAGGRVDEARLETIAALLCAERPSTVSSARDAYLTFSPMIVNDEEERFAVIALDRRGKVVDKTVLTVGTVGFTVVDPAKVLRWALTRRRPCTALLVAHNHPSGEALPSQDDRAVTRRLADACTAVGLELLDHLVCTATEFYSFAEHGAMASRSYPQPLTTK